MSLETALLAATPDDMPDAAALVASLPDPAPTGLGDPPPLPGFGQVEPAAGAEPEILSPSEFAEMWGQVHDLAGGMVQMRTGNPCPLGDQARNPGGLAAANAAYSLLAANSFTRSLILSPNSSFFGQVMVIGMHGFSCVQIIKASQLPPPDANAGQFVSVRQ